MRVRHGFVESHNAPACAKTGGVKTEGIENIKNKKERKNVVSQHPIKYRCRDYK